MKADASRTRVRLKYRAQLVMGQSPPSMEYSSAPEVGWPFLQGTADFGAVSPSPHVYCGTPTKLARAGDILFSVRAPVGELNLADQDFGIGRGLCAIRPQRLWDTRFAWWALHEARHQLNFVSTGSTYEAVATEDVGNLLVETTAPGAQRSIADYLDRETARLDALVATKERVLGLLAEKRRALITRAVTRGVHPNAPLRDSGIPWLGEIPAHWQTQRLRHISPYITVGVVVNPSSYISDHGVPFLYGSDITEEGIRCEEARRVPLEVSRGELAKTCLRAGDVVTVRVGAPGVTAVVPPELDGANCASIMLARGASSFNSHWLAYSMNSSVGRAQVGLVQYGAAQEQFNISHAVDFWFAVPPLSEQHAIVEHIARETAKLDGMRAATERTIALLKERRSALIAAAVTGQLDVGSAA